jgi:hypothetical protein
MLDPRTALEAAQRPPSAAAPALRRVLVAGGAGALGSAVLEQLLGGGGFAQVGVLVSQPLAPALRGLTPVAHDKTAIARFAPHTAVIVFDRERHANGREDAFLRPEAAELVALARRLHRAGVQHLMIVLPHAMASLPQSVQAGLMNLDEQAVAALGFAHVLMLRPAAPGGAARAGSALQRLALWVLSQLRLMVPQQQRPVRALKVAQFAAALARHLPDSPPCTRVAPSELVWQATQSDDAAAMARAWLAGQEIAPARALRERL